MKKIISLTAIATVMSLPAFASTVEVPAENFRVSSRVIQDATLSFESGEFTAHINGTAHPIDALDVRGLPAALQEDQLRSFLAQGGYLQMNPLGEEDYSLDAHMRGLGGGGDWMAKQAIKMAANSAGRKGARTIVDSEDAALVGGTVVGAATGLAFGGPIGAVVGAFTGGSIMSTSKNDTFDSDYREPPKKSSQQKKPTSSGQKKKSDQ